jgi:hypothetical protein
MASVNDAYHAWTDVAAIRVLGFNRTQISENGPRLERQRSTYSGSGGGGATHLLPTEARDSCAA